MSFIFDSLDIIRKYPAQPILGVGGLIFRGDDVLLIRRGKEPGYGQWSIPGGAVMLGETLREAVVREIREETHLEVEVVGLVKVLDRIFRDSAGRVAYHYVLADFLCLARPGEAIGDSDALEARFVPLEEISRYQLPAITLQVIRRAARLRKDARWKSEAGEESCYD